MSDETINVIRRPRPEPAEIKLPDGDSLVPRKKFVTEEVHTSERSARRWDFPTTYISGIAYIKRNESLQILADRVKRRNQPVKRRRA
jgi:hypothetical protein